MLMYDLFTVANLLVIENGVKRYVIHQPPAYLITIASNINLKTSKFSYKFNTVEQNKSTKTNKHQSSIHMHIQ